MTENVTGRIYDIQGFAVHDGPGIRTTVFTKGCPLRCLWCHSPESQRDEDELSWLSVKCIGKDKCGAPCVPACPNGALAFDEPEKSLKDGSMITKVTVDRLKCKTCLKCAEACPAHALSATGREITVDEAYARIDKDRLFFGDDGGATISGGEPVRQFDFTYNLAKKCSENGIHVCLDTTGYAPVEQLLRLLPYIDLFLYDLKHMNTVKHKSFTGVGNEIILKNARILAQNGAALQIRIPTIPKLNADMDNLKKTAEFCLELGEAVKMVQLLPYHSMGKSKYVRLGWPYRLKNIDPPDDAYMNGALKMFCDMGLPAKLH